MCAWLESPIQWDGPVGLVCHRLALSQRRNTLRNSKQTAGENVIKLFCSLTGVKGQPLGGAVELLLAGVLHGGQRDMVVLAGCELTQGVRAQLPVGQETAPGVEASGHVDHKAIGHQRPLSAPRDQCRIGGHLTEGEVLWRKGP